MKRKERTESMGKGQIQGTRDGCHQRTEPSDGGMSRNLQAKAVRRAKVYAQTIAGDALLPFVK